MKRFLLLVVSITTATVPTIALTPPLHITSDAVIGVAAALVVITLGVAAFNAAERSDGRAD